MALPLKTVSDNVLRGQIKAQKNKKDKGLPYCQEYLDSLIKEYNRRVKK
jgi:hypothetical protein